MNFLEKWIEYDYNPQIIFDEKGKIKSLNEQAQYLLGQVNAREVFDLALEFASETYGFKTIFFDIDFDKFSFFAITVGYESDEEIGIKLYRKPSQKIESLSKLKTELSNIYIIIDLAISSTLSKTQATFKKEYDPAIPDSYIDVDAFLKTLTRICSYMLSSTTITVRVYIKTGEHVKLGEKKYPLLRIEFEGDSVDERKKHELEGYTKSSQANVYIKNRSVFLDTPLITEEP